MSDDSINVVATWATKKALDAAFEQGKKLLSAFGARIASQEEDLTAAIAQHTQEISGWCSETTFADLQKPKLTSHIFVQLDCYVMPRGRRASRNEEVPTLSFAELFSGTIAHFVILGTPGAGKTTSMKNLCYRVLHEENFAQNRYALPVLIRLRDLNHAGPGSIVLLDEIASILGLKLDGGEALMKPNNLAAHEKLKLALVSAALDELRTLLVLDGFDEIVDYDRRDDVIRQIRLLTARLTTASLVLTSRTGELTAHFDGTQVFELCPLDRGQITSFAHKWLANERASENFLDQVYASPFADSAIKPLTLAHLCAIYERSGAVPDKPRSVYRKILRLLIEDWDDQRSVRRVSRYGSFDADRKYDFLANLAFELTLSASSLTFQSRLIEKIYRRICCNFDLPENQARRVAEELEGHTGLFLQAGFEVYEFAHKSLQEFLTAEFLVRLPKIPSQRKTLLKLPNELAIAVTISSDSSLYFTELVLRRFANLQADPAFYAAFATRLLQEKPDFSSNEAVIIALLALYSFTLDGAGSARSGQLSLFLFDEMMTQFEALMTLCVRRNRGFRLDQYYKVGGKANVVGKDDYYMLSRIGRHDRYELPLQLYLRKPFVIETQDLDIMDWRLISG